MKRRFRVSRRAFYAVTCGLVAGLGLLAVGGASARSSADTFKIYVMAGINTVQNNVPELAAGVQAGADAVNKAGGLGGRQIQVTPCSSQSQASVEIQCARQAVADGAEDVIGYSTFFVQSEPILEAAGIPAIGSNVNQPLDYKFKTMFPIAPGSLEEFVGATYVALKENPKAKRWAAFIQESASATANANATATIIRRFGRQYVGGVGLPPTTDVTAFAQKMKDLQPDAIIMLMSQAVNGAMESAFKTLGVTALRIHSNNVVGDPQIAAYPDQGNGYYVGAGFPSGTQTQIPTIKIYRTQLKAAGLDNDPTNLNEMGPRGWLGVWALKKLSANIKGPVTGQTLLKAAYAQHTALDLFGYKWCPACLGPAAFPNEASGLVWVMKASGGHFQLVSKTPIDVWKVLGLKRLKGFRHA